MLIKPSRILFELWDQVLKVLNSCNCRSFFTHTFTHLLLSQLNFIINWYESAISLDLDHGVECFNNAITSDSLSFAMRMAEQLLILLKLMLLIFAFNGGICWSLIF
jgi:hypothetical protein